MKVESLQNCLRKQGSDLEERSQKINEIMKRIKKLRIIISIESKK